MMTASTSAFMAGESILCTGRPGGTPAAAGPRQVAAARVMLRLQPKGRKGQPHYKIVAIDSKARRDGRPLEDLGFYNPLSKETRLKAPEIKGWLSKGAQPSEKVESILRKALLLED